jgi:hypothetical protein
MHADSSSAAHCGPQQALRGGTIAVIIAAIWRTMHETDAEAPGIPGAVRKQELREEVEGAARKQDALPLQNANDAI